MTSIDTAATTTNKTTSDIGLLDPGHKAAGLTANNVACWFGTKKVLEGVNLDMAPGQVTALIGPSGCGKSTFLRTLNRMHELVPSATLAGEILIDGVDIYRGAIPVTDVRRRIGMVFQKPNPFPAMTVAENVLAGLKLSGLKTTRSERDELIESCLSKAGLWNEVKNRLGDPGRALSGGQQQRLCIARSLAVSPQVLLMDEPCSALDPTSTRRIEQTISEISETVTVVIVTHNMQQASRVSDFCAFFLTDGGPGYLVEANSTINMFTNPFDPRTADYIQGKFG
jgi:phosphate transport system ATP-binding protein